MPSWHCSAPYSEGAHNPAGVPHAACAFRAMQVHAPGKYPAALPLLLSFMLFECCSTLCWRARGTQQQCHRQLICRAWCGVWSDCVSTTKDLGLITPPVSDSVNNVFGHLWEVPCTRLCVPHRPCFWRHVYCPCLHVSRARRDD